MNHHLKSAFAQNMATIMEERGLSDLVEGSSLHFLSQWTEKNRYEEGMRYPVFQAAASPENLHLRLKVTDFAFIYMHLYV